MGDEKVGIRQVMGSVAAAFFGVQSDRNRQRDFRRGRPRDFLIIGALFTALFVLAVIGLVQLVLHLTASA